MCVCVCLFLCVCLCVCVCVYESCIEIHESEILVADYQDR